MISPAEKLNKECHIRNLENTIFELCEARLKAIGTPLYTPTIDTQIKNLTEEMMRETTILLDETKTYEGLKAKDVVI